MVRTVRAIIANGLLISEKWSGHAMISALQFPQVIDDLVNLLHKKAGERDLESLP